MINIKKVKPMFTRIVTTADKYEKDQTSGSVILAAKQEGTMKEYQTVVAVGENSAGIKPGMLVMIDPIRYAVMKHREGSLKDGVITDNPVIGYNIPRIMLDGVEHLLLDATDVEFIVEEYDDPDSKEKTMVEKAAAAGIYTPMNEIIP